MRRRAGAFALCGEHARSWGARDDVGAARTRLLSAIIVASGRALSERIPGPSALFLSGSLVGELRLSFGEQVTTTTLLLL